MATGSDVKLLGGWPSPYSVRVRIILNLKNIDYEYLEEKLGSGIKTELLLSSNPVHKKVPVMIHNGNPICESLIIVQYIDEVFTSGPSILPTDPYDRAIARFWADYIDNTWSETMFVVGRAQSEEEKAVAAGQMNTATALLENTFEQVSRGKAFFGGDEIGYVDITLGSYLMWLKVVEKLSGYMFIDETKTPSLNRWAERFTSDAAVKEVIPETDKLLEFAKMLISKGMGRIGAPPK